jgi:5-methylcytosine-specific restriction endonuclease McrA
MPCDYSQYPKDWARIVADRKKEVGNCCELCGVRNGGLHWKTASKVVLTMHHIDHDKKNNSRQNLILLCQRCHLRLDLAHHMENRKGAKQERLAI